MTSGKIKGIKLKERLGVAPRQGGERGQGKWVPFHDPRCGLFVTNITEVFGTGGIGVWGKGVSGFSLLSVSLKLFQNKK